MGIFWTELKLAMFLLALTGFKLVTECLSSFAKVKNKISVEALVYTILVIQCKQWNVLEK